MCEQTVKTAPSERFDYEESEVEQEEWRIRENGGKIERKYLTLILRMCLVDRVH